MILFTASLPPPAVFLLLLALAAVGASATESLSSPSAASPSSPHPASPSLPPPPPPPLNFTHLLEQGLRLWDSGAAEEGERAVRAALVQEHAIVVELTRRIQQCWNTNTSVLPASVVRRESSLEERDVLARIECELSTQPVRSWLREQAVLPALLRRAVNRTAHVLPDHRTLFQRAVVAYRTDQPQLAVGLFDAALVAHVQAQARCWAEMRCYRGILQEEPRGPEASIAVEDVAYALVCRRECRSSLKNIMLDGNYMDFFAAATDHVQFSLYHIHDYISAAECGEAHMVGNPSNVNMRNNIRHYNTVAKAALQHIPTACNSSAYLVSATHREGILGNSLPSGAVQLATMTYNARNRFRFRCFNPGAAACGAMASLGQCAHRPDWMLDNCPIECGICTESLEPHPPADTTSSSQSETANKPKPPSHAIRDHVLTPEECDALVKLSYFAVPGDGYDGVLRPFSQSESFAGLTPESAAELLRTHPQLSSEVRLLHQASMRALAETKESMGLASLFFHYTHLVVRTNTGGEAGAVLSHPIHGDNCVPINGTCVRTPPAFTARDFSSVLFLNSDFSGGKFFFADDFEGSNPAYVEPKCGRLVSFPAHVLHGVTPLGPRARRVVVAHWYTLDESVGQDLQKAFKNAV